MKKIIFLNGKKRSGKNFVGNLLNKYLRDFGYNVKEVSFAYHLKNDVCIMLGITMEELEYHKDLGTEFQIGDKKFSLRTILQNYGTEVRRAENDDIWLERALPDIFDNDADVIIITDWRFQSEWMYFAKSLTKGTPYSMIPYDIFDVNIPNQNIVSNDAHSSENDLNHFNFEFYIPNHVVFDNLDDADKAFEKYFEIIRKRFDD